LFCSRLPRYLWLHFYHACHVVCIITTPATWYTKWVRLWAVHTIISRKHTLTLNCVSYKIIVWFVFSLSDFSLWLKMSPKSQRPPQYWLQWKNARSRVEAAAAVQRSAVERQILQKDCIRPNTFQTLWKHKPLPFTSLVENVFRNPNLRLRSLRGAGVHPRRQAWHSCWPCLPTGIDICFQQIW
jgi:hypothetical protein